MFGNLRKWTVLSWMVVAAFLATGAWWLPYSHIPSVGKGGLLLAVGATLMPLFWEKAGVIGKMAWVAMLFLLLGVEYRAIDKDRSDAATAEGKRRDAENTQFQTIANGITTSLQQSQAQFDATMKGVNQDIRTATGGASFCYMIFSTDQLGTINAIPTFVQVGKYPLTDLDARIVNLDDYNKAFQGNIGLEQALNAAGTKVPLGNLSGGTALINPQWKIALSDNLNYRVFFNAKNGFWMEDLEVRRLNGNRMEALRIRRQNGNKTPTIFQKIDKGFPRVRGAVEWPK